MAKRINGAGDVDIKGPNVISASAIARQFWCEMQVDLRRKYGDMEKPEKEVKNSIKNCFSKLVK